MAIIKKRPETEEAPAYTEANIQAALSGLYMARGQDLAIPNCGAVYGWEADLLTVTKAGRVHEYEIKVDRGDWLSEYRNICSLYADVKVTSAVKRQRAKQLAGLFARPADRPNHFWLVTAPGVAYEQEVPEFAGWIEMGQHRGALVPDIRKRAPKIHGEPIGDNHLRMIARGLCLRYWQIRKEVG